MALALLSRALPAAAQQRGVLLPTKGGPRPIAAGSAPFELTSSDGAGLELVSVKVRGVVEDPLAFTELHLRFYNPEDRVREGRFRITLPVGATISRFAMKISGNWMEGEVVERQAARRAYEDFLHRRQDPALLENEAGNEFSARVFPIPARGEKELIISYSQTLTRSDSPYSVPLVGLPKLRELDARILVSRSTVTAKAASSLGGAVTRQEVVETQRRDFRPDRDLVIDRRARGADDRIGLRHDNLAVARIMPIPAVKMTAASVSNLIVLFDTSASRALGFAEQVRKFSSTIAALRAAGDFELQVMVFDQTMQTFYRGKARDWGDDDAQRLLQRRAEGASDLAGALAGLAKGTERADRLLIVSDGVRTAGDTDGDVLRQRVRALSAIGIKRVDVMAVGGIRDDAALSTLVRGALSQDGMVLDAEAPDAELAGRMRSNTRSGLHIKVPGARWVWPDRLDGVQPGDEILVFVDLPPEKPLVVMVGDVRVADEQKSQVGRVARPLLEREWVNARLRRLTEQRDGLATGDTDLRAALVKQMIDLSTQYRVLCDYTALLVLETEADYQRFGIDRRALADILVAGGAGIEVLNRKGREQVLVPINNPKPIVRRDQENKGDADLAKRKSSEAEDDGAADVSEGASKDESVAGEKSVQAEEAPSPSVAAPSPRPASAPASESRAAGAAGSSAGSLGGAPARMRSSRGQRAEPTALASSESTAAPPLSGPPALTGELAAIMSLIKNGQAKAAHAKALAWRTREPGDVLAIVALGESLRALGNYGEAARVFGSIIDLFPSRTDLRRFVSGHLERLADKASLQLAVDCLRKVVEQRPDHPSSHHMLAMALLKTADPAGAFAAIEVALQQSYPDGRFAGADRILREDLGLTGAAWLAVAPSRRAEIEFRLQNAGGQIEETRSVRFVLSWETDANDVDFHIQDSRGGHAYYSSPTLPSGGELYADVTTGYGPECFTVRGAPKASPYRLSAHYYSRGPMGYGMGRIEAIEHDGRGHFHFDSRPFVVMNDGAYVNLGTFAPGKRG
jgi:tetratricopeptide (TPR) repeat protein/predicted ATPase